MASLAENVGLFVGKPSQARQRVKGVDVVRFRMSA
jgi:hypothetical protein